MIATLVALSFVTFHTPDGRFIQINPAAVISLVHPHDPPHPLMAEGVNCLIRLTGGYASVMETCEEVQKILEGEEP